MIHRLTYRWEIKIENHMNLHMYRYPVIGQSVKTDFPPELYLLLCWSQWPSPLICVAFTHIFSCFTLSVRASQLAYTQTEILIQRQPFTYMYSYELLEYTNSLLLYTSTPLHVREGNITLHFTYLTAIVIYVMSPFYCSCSFYFYLLWHCLLICFYACFPEYPLSALSVKARCKPSF